MGPLRRLLPAVGALGLALPLHAGELGDPAAGIKAKEWVKGKEVDVTKADGEQVYVVEFWATWCGPCRDSIPHLSELQTRYKDKVTFIGVSTDDERTIDAVKPFVEKMGERMNYTVAIDDGNATADAYMKAFGINGIPHAFVVHKGKIVWHQNPHPRSPDGDLAEVLDAVVASKFTMDDAKKRIAAREEKMRRMRELGELAQQYFELVGSTGKEAEAAKLGEKLIAAGGENASFLNMLAWRILTDEGVVARDHPLALRAAEMANRATGGEDASILDTYALALFRNGRKAEAVKHQEKAVELARKGGDEELLKELSERLEMFRKE